MNRKIFNLKLFSLLLLFALSAFKSFQAVSAEKCVILYFLEKDCREKCREADEIILPRLREIYGEKIKVLRKDVGNPSDFEALMAFEGRYGVPPGEVPEFYTKFGDVQKQDNISEKLTALIEKELSSDKPGVYNDFFSNYLKTCETGIPISESIQKQYKDSNSPLNVLVFQKPGCRTCDRLNISTRYLSKKYSGQVKIFTYKIDDNKAKVLNEALCIKYRIPEKFHLATPAIFFGTKYFAGEQSMKTVNIVGEILEALKTAGKFPTPTVSEDDLVQAERAIVERYSSISWGAVLSAGLIDGINPCAFVTIIFLLSYLALMEYRKQDIIFVGISFTAAVFLTYLLIGLGFLKFAKYLETVPFLAQIIYYLAVFLAALVGILNLSDFIKIRRGSMKNMKLKLSDDLRQKINAVIRRNIRIQHFVLGAAIIGFGVSVLELACTGQTYLPTVLFIVNIQGFQAKAFLLLLFYNIAFIVPLIIVFVLYLYGVTDKQFSAWLGRHGAKIKLATGLLFIGLAVLLLFIK